MPSKPNGQARAKRIEYAHQKQLKQSIPSPTLLLYRTSRTRAINYERLAQKLSLSLQRKVNPLQARQMLRRFVRAWKLRALENQGLSRTAAAKKSRMGVVVASELVHDRDFHIPPKAPRMSVKEMAKKLKVSEKEVRKWLQWKPTK